MQVSKWGNDALDLKEGDQIEIRIAGERVFEVSRDQTKPHELSRQTPTCFTSRICF